MRNSVAQNAEGGVAVVGYDDYQTYQTTNHVAALVLLADWRAGPDGQLPVIEMS